MSGHPFTRVLLAAALAAACVPAARAESPPAPAEAEAPAAAPMTRARLVALLERERLDPQGDGAQLVFYVKATRVIAVVDEANDRMRFMVPVGRAEDLDAGGPLELLKANYHATGDLRFAVNRGVVWLAYLHPLSTLTERDALGAINQLVHHAVRLTGPDAPQMEEMSEGS